MPKAKICSGIFGSGECSQQPLLRAISTYLCPINLLISTLSGVVDTLYHLTLKMFLYSTLNWRNEGKSKDHIIVSPGGLSRSPARHSLLSALSDLEHKTTCWICNLTPTTISVWSCLRRQHDCHWQRQLTGSIKQATGFKTPLLPGFDDIRVVLLTAIQHTFDYASLK